MAKTNVLFSFNSYEDASSSNNPNMNHFKWTRQVANADCNEPQSMQTTVQPGQSTQLFNDSVTLSQSMDTAYGIVFVTGTTYKLSHDAGTAPGFRIDRQFGGDATTEMDVSVSGSAITYTHSGGLAPDLSNVVVGDEAIITAPFAAQNQGQFKILAKTTDSFTVANTQGAVETGVVLDVGTPILIQGSNGVQVGDRVYLPASFGAGLEGVYDITSVRPDSLNFVSTVVLPSASSVLAEIAVFSKAKKAVYIEASKPVRITVNNSSEINIRPAFMNGPGMMFLNDMVWSLEVEPIGLEAAVVFVASVE